MNVVYFFRKRVPYYHSIEELFESITQNISDNIKYSKYYVKYESNSILNILRNSVDVILKQADVNHITGDIHYIALLLKKRKTILTIHDLVSLSRGNWLKRKFIWLLWFYLPCKLVRYITVISNSTKAELHEKVSVNSHKIKVIPNCVSPSIKFSPKQFNNLEPVILQKPA